MKREFEFLPNYFMSCARVKRCIVVENDRILPVDCTSTHLKVLLFRHLIIMRGASHRVLMPTSNVCVCVFVCAYLFIIQSTYSMPKTKLKIIK